MSRKYGSERERVAEMRADQFRKAFKKQLRDEEKQERRRKALQVSQEESRRAESVKQEKARLKLTPEDVDQLWAEAKEKHGRLSPETERNFLRERLSAQLRQEANA